MTKEEITIPRWLLERIEDTLRIQYNINLDKKTGETCQDRNIKESLNGVRKLLRGEELTGGERLERLQPSLPTIKGWIARDDADRLGLYDQKPTRKTEPGVFSGIAHSWVIGDTWIGRFSLDQTAKPLFPNLRWEDEPRECELIIREVK